MKDSSEIRKRLKGESAGDNRELNFAEFNFCVFNQQYYNKARFLFIHFFLFFFAKIIKQYIKMTKSTPNTC